MTCGYVRKSVAAVSGYPSVKESEIHAKIWSTCNICFGPLNQVFRSVPEAVKGINVRSKDFCNLEATAEKALLQECATLTSGKVHLQQGFTSQYQGLWNSPRKLAIALVELIWLAEPSEREQQLAASPWAQNICGDGVIESVGVASKRRLPCKDPPTHIHTHTSGLYAAGWMGVD